MIIHSKDPWWYSAPGDRTPNRDLDRLGWSQYRRPFDHPPPPTPPAYDWKAEELRQETQADKARALLASVGIRIETWYEGEYDDARLCFSLWHNGELIAENVDADKL